MGTVLSMLPNSMFMKGVAASLMLIGGLGVSQMKNSVDNSYLGSDSLAYHSDANRIDTVMYTDSIH